MHHEVLQTRRRLQGTAHPPRHDVQPCGCGTRTLPPAIKAGRRRLSPATEFEQRVAQVIAPLQEAPRRDALPFPEKTGRPRQIDMTDSLP